MKTGDWKGCTNIDRRWWIRIIIIRSYSCWILTTIPVLIQDQEESTQNLLGWTSFVDKATNVLDEMPALSCWSMSRVGIKYFDFLLSWLDHLILIVSFSAASGPQNQTQHFKKPHQHIEMYLRPIDARNRLLPFWFECLPCFRDLICFDFDRMQQAACPAYPHKNHLQHTTLLDSQSPPKSTHLHILKVWRDQINVFDW